jgi:CHAT domain
MTTAPGPSEDVRRVLARDDLLMMAADADQAVGIVRQREALARRTKDEKSLFSVALGHYLKAAKDKNKEWAIRAQAWKHAGVIVRFGELVDIPAELPQGVRYTAAELHALSLSQLDEDDTTGPRDLALHAFHRYRAARDLRLDGQIEDALRLSSVDRDALNGGGAEPHMAHLMYEVGAAYITAGQARDAEDGLREMNSYFTRTRAAGFSTRYRFDLIRALAQWENADAQAGTGLRHALRRVARRQVSLDEEHPQPARGVELLSVTLARAEYLATHARTDHDRAEAVRLGRQALRIADDVRGRWRVIARSRAPLAVVFQRVYGDIALLAARLDVPGAAELGLRVALSAKQTGFAARMRTGRQLLSPRVRDIIESIVAVEGGARGLEPDTGIAEKLDNLHFELAEAVSPMLADTVLPPPADLSKLTRLIGDRYALDYLELADSLAGVPNLFRTLVRPDGRKSFERFTPPPYYARFFAHARRRQNLALLLNLASPAPTRSDREFVRDRPLDQEDHQVVGEPGAFDWAVLAEQILPGELRAELAAADRPLQLIISAHSWLSLVPWPALTITDAAGRPARLVERAIVTQTPAFTCLHHEQPPPVAGRALIRLVGMNEEGVDVTAEREAWGLDAVSDGLALSGAPVAAGPLPRPPLPQPLSGSLSEAMEAGPPWGFVHIAAHGDGEGLTQRLRIPDDPLSFGQALVLKWPGSVLMASCHVGRVINVAEAEPLNLVMGMLTGGARCVVAGITSIDDRGTGRAASAIIRAIRGDGVSLDVALRDAQLAAVRDEAPEREWALLGAYLQ